MPRDPWRELEELLRRPPEGVVAELERLLPAVGIDPPSVIEDGGGLTRLRQLVQQRKAERRSAGRLEAERRAQRAAEALRRTARHQDGTALLDHRLVLGELAMHPAELVAFELGEVEVIVLRKLLRDARRALRPFPDVRCFLGERALHFRWRRGRGGLDLAYGYELKREERQRLFRVPLPPVPTRLVSTPVLLPTPVPAPTPEGPPATPLPSGAPAPGTPSPARRTRWPVLLGEVLSDLGLVP